MKKVEFLGFVDVDTLVSKLSNEIEFLNNGFEYDEVKEYILENGSGVYELMFGCRGGLEELQKNDEYLSLEELVDEAISNYGEEELENNDCNSKEELMEVYSEFYSDDENFVLENENWAKCVSFYEESWSLFINVKV